MSFAAVDETLTLDRRHAARERMLQRAQIVVEDRVFDCVLLDLTPGGARVETMLPLNLPDRFAIRFADGRQALCERRWRVGQRMGLMFLRASARSRLPDRATALLGMFETLGHRALFDMLRDENYLQSAAVGEAVWRADAALAALEAALRAVAEEREEAGRQAAAS